MNDKNLKTKKLQFKKKYRIGLGQSRSSWYKHWWGVADHQSAICHQVVANFFWWCL